jgi:hypothetical protein
MNLRNPKKKRAKYSCPWRQDIRFGRLLLAAVE